MRWTMPRPFLNDAYRTLRDPLARAEYLLKENGFPSESKTRRMFRRNCWRSFRIEHWPRMNCARDDSARQSLEDARNKFTGMRDAIDTELAEKFREYDRSREA